MQHVGSDHKGEKGEPHSLFVFFGTEMSSGVQNTLMFPGNGNAGNNNAQKPVNQYPPNQYYLFSPTFQCYTSTPFYRNLLIELEHVASYIDQGKSRSREIVWRQLFTLLGAKPVVCSKPFEPVLKSWTESPTINLLAIELLYLAFATAFDRFPDLIKTRFPSGTQIPFPNNNEVHLVHFYAPFHFFPQFILLILLFKKSP